MTGVKGRSGSGGKRPGAGRPKSAPTKTKTFRIDAEALQKAEDKFGKTLNQKVNNFIKRISK
jgi:hypothetical protein